jgi:hypothetical protein
MKDQEVQSFFEQKIHSANIVLFEYTEFVGCAKLLPILQKYKTKEDLSLRGFNIKLLSKIKN